MQWETPLRPQHSFRSQEEEQSLDNGLLHPHQDAPVSAGNCGLLGGRRAGDPLPTEGTRALRPDFLALIAMARQIRRDLEIFERELERVARNESWSMDEYAAMLEDSLPHDGSSWKAS